MTLVAESRSGIIEMRLNRKVLPERELEFAEIMQQSGAGWVVYDLSGKRGAPVYLTSFNACLWVVKTKYPRALTFPIETFVNMLRDEEVKNDD